MAVDVLAIGAHPDDVDLGVGGTLLALAEQGYRTAILDLTRGERATRGTPDERAKEAAEAAKRLGAGVRDNAGLPDGAIANTEEQQRAVIPFIRRHQPAVILAHASDDRHPDHRNTHALTRDANFFAGLTSIETAEAPYRAPSVVFFHPYYESDQPPAAVMDISAVFEQKLDALRAYASQFYNEEYPGEATMVSSKAFWDAITIRAAYWGHRIDAAYGEPLYYDGPLPIRTLPGLGAAP